MELEIIILYHYIIMKLYFSLFLLIILFVIYVNSQRINWSHSDALSVLNIESKKWGKPYILAKKKGGFAIWTKEQLKDTCFFKIILQDESVPHCVPLPHRDFLYTYIKYELSPKLFSDVLSLSGSVSYDPLKKLISARCGSQEANIATLYLATEIASGHQTIQNIQKNKLYKKTILSTKDPKNVDLLYKKLCDNVKNQPGNPEFTGYWPAAFKEGCCAGYNPKTNTCQ